MDTNTQLDNVLALYDGKYVGLLSAVSDWRAGTCTELSYTGYSDRPVLNLAAATNTTPAGGRQRSNSGSVVFSVNTGSAQTAVAWAVYSAATGGSPLRIVPLGTYSSVTAIARSDTEDFYAPGHGLSAGQRVWALPTTAGSLPGGVSMNTTYWVISAGLTTDSLRLSTSSGGSSIDVTGWGAAVLVPYTPVQIDTGTQPVFAVGSLVLRQY